MNKPLNVPPDVMGGTFGRSGWESVGDAELTLTIKIPECKSMFCTSATISYFFGTWKRNVNLIASMNHQTVTRVQ